MNKTIFSLCAAVTLICVGVLAYTDSDGLKTIAAILLIFLIFPSFLMLVVDLARSPDNPSKGIKFFANLIRILLGLLSVFFGLVMLVWGTYNQVFERVPEFRDKGYWGPLLAATQGFLFFSIGCAWLRKEWIDYFDDSDDTT